jgi:hypothetical protein
MLMLMKCNTIMEAKHLRCYTSAHLQNFLEISSTIVIKDIAQDIILLYLFLFSSVERAKQWFYTNKDQINTWAKYSKAFLEKFF